MENKYLIQIKGKNENKFCWITKATFNNLKMATKNYNSYTSGCCKRILRERIIKEVKIMRFKKY